MRHPLVKSAVAVSLLAIAAIAAVLLAWNAGYWRSGLIRLASWQSGRAIEVRGALSLHLLSGNPRLEAEGVTIGNPPWTKPGITAEIAKLSVTFAPLLSHRSGLSILEIDGAQLHFSRDGEGRANWQRADPLKSPSRPLPMIRALQLTHSHLELTDERLHLAYDGDLSVVGPDSPQPLQMDGAGILNQHPVAFHLKGDALPSAAPDKAYAFEFDERSSGTHVTAHGSLPHPFDVSRVDADFEAGGADLRDLYYLVGVRLPNTGSFHLQGRLQRRGSETRFDALEVTSGESDVQGWVSIHTHKGGRTQVQMELGSTLLRVADVGLRAAGRDPHPDAPRKLFSSVRLITPATRRVDVSGKYSARRLLLSRLEVSDLSAPFTIERGLVKAPQVTGHVMGGNVLLQLDADANQSPARTRIDMTLTDLQLARMSHESEPPYEGSLFLKIHAQGRGDSLHALAAGADGTFGARLLRGTLRASLAELIGVDLRGLGLALTGSKREVAVRCAAADFEIHAGVMQPTRLFVDSEPVFISGEGRVLLDPETLDLALHGEPKGLRILRLKAPVLVQGTLLQPKFSVDVPNSQLRLVDRGKARDADCTALQPL